MRWYANKSRRAEIGSLLKAGSVSALVGTLAGLPLPLTEVAVVFWLVLPSGINFISCALFGIILRCAVGRDLDDVQLKTGTSASFGFIRGTYSDLIELNLESFPSHAFSDVVYIAEGLLIFVFAAVG